ncbi:uncharacterized protein LOC117915149 [Vitis riparia]|uniref:uncharacterized protein LOC117915149 n=1 Tax=Vitis riparia TaxID=96939 RepID=UPI00155A10DC|nr:uncharacterized protein LOC117915149 [Vitis riparia]
MYEGTVGPIEGASDSVDPPLSFDILSGFITRFDCVSDDSVMDLSIYEYSSVSYDDVSLFAPYSLTSQIFDINDEIAQPNSDRDSFDHDSDPIDERVSPVIGDVEIIDFGTNDQPRELKIEWLANVVPVPKKDGKVRVCVDFRDLNKASPKDDFSLPHIDLLVDGTAGHSMLSFMDGFSGYNQILMASEDMEKTAFITELGTYCYKVMPFGLKNAGATYQRAVTTLFHDMMHKDVEVYVDDMIVKSRVPPMPGRPLLLYLSVSDMALGCMLAQLDDSGNERVIYYLTLVWTTRRLRHYMTEYSVHLISRLDPLRYLFDRPALAGRLMRWLVLLTEFDIHYVSQKSIKGSIVADHLASLPIIESRPIDDDFPDEEFGDHIPRSVRLTFPDYHPTTNNIVEYEACILGLETALELGITQMDVLGDSNLVLRQVWGDWKTRDAKLKPYHAYLELLIEKFEELKYIHLSRAHNQFVDALATLASTVDIPTNVIVRPLLIETRSAPAYCHLIDETEIQDDLPWFHDIRQFLRSGTYLEAATAKDRRALRQLATRFVICGETLYRRSVDGILLLCLDRASSDRLMREVHAGVCGPHMGGHMLTHKIMRAGYFWLTMETDCCQFV